MWKIFRKIIIGNRNICKILKIFLLPTVEISFFSRLYLRNGASLTPQTLHFFGQKILDERIFSLYEPAKIPRLNSFPFGEKLKNMKIFCITIIHFHHLFSSISLQPNVFRGSNFKLYGFKNSVHINYWGIHLW